MSLLFIVLIAFLFLPQYVLAESDEHRPSFILSEVSLDVSDLIGTIHLEDNDGREIDNIDSKLSSSTGISLAFSNFDLSLRTTFLDTLLGKTKSEAMDIKLSYRHDPFIFSLELYQFKGFTEEFDESEGLKIDRDVGIKSQRVEFLYLSKKSNFTTKNLSQFLPPLVEKAWDYVISVQVENIDFEGDRKLQSFKINNLNILNVNSLGGLVGAYSFDNHWFLMGQLLVGISVSKIDSQSEFGVKKSTARVTWDSSLLKASFGYHSGKYYGLLQFDSLENVFKYENYHLDMTSTRSMLVVGIHL